MKYVLLFAAEGDDIARFDRMSSEEQAAQFAQVGAWFQLHGPKMRGGNQLAPPQTARTVRFDGQNRPLVTDGPFLESKEVIGGYAEFELESLDEAVQLASTWPARGTVEVRPVLEMGSGQP